KRCAYIRVAPMPPPPATISAVNAVISATGTATRNAAKMRGEHAGRITRHMIMERELPSDSDDQISRRLTEMAALYVAITIGNYVTTQQRRLVSCVAVHPAAPISAAIWESCQRKHRALTCSSALSVTKAAITTLATAANM